MYDYDRGEKGDTTNEFSLKDEQHSLKWWMLQKPFQGFLSEQPLFNFAGNEGIYSVGEGQESHT